MTPQTRQFGVGPGGESPASALGPGVGTAAGRWDWLVRQPSLGTNALIALVLAVAVSCVFIWTSRQVLVAIDQPADQTFVVRTGFTLDDREATEADRQAARQRAPRVYLADGAALGAIRTSLDNLPRTLANAENLDAVDPGIRKQFGLTQESLDALRRQTGTPQGQAVWASRVRALDEALRLTPLVDAETFQRETLSGGAAALELRFGEDGQAMVRPSEMISLADRGLARLMRSLAAGAGFEGLVLEVVASRLAAEPKATFRFDEAQSLQRQQEAAAATPVRRVRFQPGQLIVAAGERMTASRLDILETEMREYRRQSAWAGLVSDGAMIGLAALTSLALLGYVGTYSPRITASPARLAATAALLTGCLTVSCAIGAAAPQLMGVAITTPAVFASVVMAVIFDRRTALALGSLLALVTCVALRQPGAGVALAMCGVATVAWRLRETRLRNSLIRAATVTAAALMIGSLILSPLRHPMTADSSVRALWEAASVGVGALLVGFLVLGILPTAERLLGVTTGMTLIELRDPKHPLLRALQQRAPGTYNHSLNVASLAEAAAEAIGADGLLAYVGALYHDVGKMSKPEFFVENQVGGLNPHEKLSPAMSLLVIVAHVKDGVELAREANLPRVLHHFIESHHGTTLVEYFYHRARRQAEAGGAMPGAGPMEIEYRYPGPKPRTREAAILMICDAAESATRTLTEPTPLRIESLVRAIASKRLTDGQLDESEITLRDLTRIVEAVSKALASIYHPRIAYPEAVVTRGRPPSPGISGPTPTQPGLPTGAAEPAARRP